MNPESFEKNYIEIRKKEGLFFTDEQVRRLPEVAEHDPHFDKWTIRKKTTNNLIAYLKNKSSFKTILDLGCGNGWMTAALAQNIPAEIHGWDVNQTELDQAQRIFNTSNLHFKYQDVFDKNIITRFDCIVVCSAIQYFSDFDKITGRLLALLNKNGEIHILDSPFYKENEIAKAKKRTVDYYTKLGHPEMAQYYFHHTIDSIKNFSHKILYHPNTWQNKLIRKLGKARSPFPWICIYK